MKITFMIGNGFDLAAGFDTSYSSFYNWYCSQPSDKFHIKTFKRDIQKDIENKGENWSDFEIGLGKYTQNFDGQTVHDFIDCHEDAREGIVEFLTQRSHKYSGQISDAEYKRLREGVMEFYQELQPEELNVFDSIFEADKSNDIEMQFISFNYTDILDKCVKVLSKEPLKRWMYGNKWLHMNVNPNVIHIHGTLNEFPILGINDASQITKQDLLDAPQFPETMIKSKSVEAIGRLWHNQAKKTINSSDIICIFGMSLGESDSIWWQRILTWLQKGENRRLIIFWHTNTPLNGRSVYKQISEVRKVKDKITSYADYTNDVIYLIEHRIHVILNTSKFLQVSFDKKNN